MMLAAPAWAEANRLVWPPAGATQRQTVGDVYELEIPDKLFTYQPRLPHTHAHTYQFHPLPELAHWTIAWSKH